MSRGRGDVRFAIASCAVLAAYNNLAGTLPWHRRRYILLNVCATGAALAAAAASGLTATDLGLGRAELLPGVRLGSRLAAAAAGGWVLIAAVPATRPVLRDERIIGLSGRELAYQVLLRIPLGTVLWEETAFRGVLQAALGRVMPAGAAIAVTSGVFGIWHIHPTAGADPGRRRLGRRGDDGRRRAPVLAAGAFGQPGRARAAPPRHELRRRADGLGHRPAGAAGCAGGRRPAGLTAAGCAASRAR